MSILQIYVVILGVRSLLSPFIDRHSTADNLNLLQKLRLYRMERDSRWWLVMREDPGTYDCELEEARYVYSVFRPLIRAWLTSKRLRTERRVSRVGLIPNGSGKLPPTDILWSRSSREGGSK